MPKDKYGNYLNWKEFFSRWRQGIEGITPYQQARMTFYNTWVIVLGLLCGIVVSAFAIKTLWWLEIVLVGALFNTIILQIGNYQKYRILKQLEESFSE